MKKLLACFLVVIMAVSMVACGPVNSKDVAILWSGEDTAKVPGTLIDTMERAMYTQNISYKHYGANGDAKNQLTQAQSAVETSAALVVNLIDISKVTEFMALAIEKDIPIIFFGCNIDEKILSNYNKAYCVYSDASTIPFVRQEQIKGFIEANKDEKTGKNKLDKNGDGKISYSDVGTGAPILDAEKLDLVYVDFSVDELNEEAPNKAKAELIVTSSDKKAIETLEKMQAKGFNKDKLVTHYIPLFTIGSLEDARHLSLAAKEMEKEEYEQFIYTAKEIIDAGQMNGTVIEDNDGLSEAVSIILNNLLKGEKAVKNIDKDIISGQTVKIPYTFI